MTNLEDFFESLHMTNKDAIISPFAVYVGMSVFFLAITMISGNYGHW